MSDCCSSSPPPSDKDREGSSCCGSGGNDDGGGCCGSAGKVDWLLWGSMIVFAIGFGLHYWQFSLPSWIETFAHACHMLAMKAWWGLLFGIIAMAVLSRVPKELVAAILGRGGSISGLFRAVAAGVMLDLCNHGILMVGMGLYKRGTSLGQTIAFLIASPWNSLSLTLILAALIGWKWVLLFILFSMVVGVITGWVADRCVSAGMIPKNPNEVDLPKDYKMGKAIKEVLKSLKPGLKNYGELAREGLSESKMILRWIFFGFVLTGLIQALVPTDVFQQYFGPTLLGLFLTLIATTILEVCSEGSAPIAADLLSRAQAPGNAFVFLMAGAATDYTEIMALKETTKSWKATIALPLISVPQVLLIGWLIQRFG